MGLHKVDFLTDNLPHYRLNEAFMAFGAVGVFWNVVTRYGFEIQGQAMADTFTVTTMSINTRSPKAVRCWHR